MHAHTRQWTNVARTAALVVLLMAALSARASAYDYAGAGGRLGMASPNDLDGTPSLGVHAEFEQSGSRVHLQPDVMYWKTNGVRDVNPNFDVYYHFDRENRVSPYVGGGVGLNFVRRERIDRDNTDVGLNLVSGMRFPGENHHVFVEGRYTASDISQISLLGGVTFHAP